MNFLNIFLKRIPMGFFENLKLASEKMLKTCHKKTAWNKKNLQNISQKNEPNEFMVF